MYCGDEEPRKSVDSGSHGRLGQRHMADRCIESKAVHINQSATGTQALMGWRLGDVVGGQKQDPPQLTADRRAANLWPSASVRLVLAVLCAVCCA